MKIINSLTIGLLKISLFLTTYSCSAMEETKSTYPLNLRVYQDSDTINHWEETTSYRWQRSIKQDCSTRDNIKINSLSDVEDYLVGLQAGFYSHTPSMFITLDQYFVPKCWQFLSALDSIYHISEFLWNEYKDKIFADQAWGIIEVITKNPAIKRAFQYHMKHKVKDRSLSTQEREAFIMFCRQSKDWDIVIPYLKRLAKEENFADFEKIITGTTNQKLQHATLRYLLKDKVFLKAATNHFEDFRKRLCLSLGEAHDLLPTVSSESGGTESLAPNQVTVAYSLGDTSDEQDIIQLYSVVSDNEKIEKILNYLYEYKRINIIVDLATRYPEKIENVSAFIIKKITNEKKLASEKHFLFCLVSRINNPSLTKPYLIMLCEFSEFISFYRLFTHLSEDDQLDILNKTLNLQQFERTIKKSKPVLWNKGLKSIIKECQSEKVIEILTPLLTDDSKFMVEITRK